VNVPASAGSIGRSSRQMRGGGSEAAIAHEHPNLYEFVCVRVN